MTSSARGKPRRRHSIIILTLLGGALAETACAAVLGIEEPFDRAEAGPEGGAADAARTDEPSGPGRGTPPTPAGSDASSDGDVDAAPSVIVFATNVSTATDCADSWTL